MSFFTVKKTLTTLFNTIILYYTHTHLLIFYQKNAKIGVSEDVNFLIQLIFGGEQ